MCIKAILFDLDGTLLPMDQDEFTRAYFEELAATLTTRGYETKQLIETIWVGTAAMVKNDGSRHNEDAFWEVFAGIYGENGLKDKPYFDAFYRTEFQNVRTVCGFNPLAASTVHFLKENGFRVILATNPIFPAIATESRIRWCELSPDDFELYTTYENSCYCKPNPKYYEEILNRQGLKPEECLMVGNDVEEDMIAETLGMKVFLLTDCMINKNNVDISRYPHGDFAKLLEWINTERLHIG